MSKPLLTVRVTTIEAFREWINHDKDDDKAWINEASIIRKVQCIEDFGIKAAYGTAGHSIIEEAPRYWNGNAYVVDDFIFSESQVQPLLKFRQEHPLMIRETALSKVYSTPRFDIVITGTSDHLEGAHMRDTKFKFSSFDVQDFIESIQYKLYLDMAGMDIFYFDFFKVDKFEKMEDVAQSVIGNCDSLMLRRYPTMESDIQAVLNEFADWVAFKNLEPYLVITKEKYKRIIRGDSTLKKYISI